MNVLNHSQQLSPNIKKAMVAVLLGVVLIAIVVMQQTNPSVNSQSDSASLCDGNAPPASVPTQVGKEHSIEESPLPEELLPLPKVDLKQVLSHNPFRSQGELKNESDLPSTNGLVANRTAETEQVFENQNAMAPIEIPVSAIVTGSRGSAALIGGNLYREKDLLEGGWKIVAIKSNSILIESVSSENGE